MISHYVTLKALTNELAPILKGAVITEAYSQEKNGLFLTCDHLHGTGTICISVEPHFSYLYLRDAVQRKKRNSADVFPEIIGEKITRITIHPDDRIISIILENGNVLQMQLFNTAASNVILVNSSGQIIEAFKNNKLLCGTMPELKKGGRRILPEQAQFTVEFRRQTGMHILAALKKTVPGLPAFFLSEALYRIHRNGSDKVTDLDDEMAGKLFVALSAIVDECSDPHPRVYIPKDDAPFFSLIALSSQSNSGEKAFTTISDGIRAVVSQKFRDSHIDDQRETIQTVIERERNKHERTYQTLQSQQLVDPSEYEQIGQLLLSYLHKMKKGMKHIDLPGLTDPAVVTHVTLDPALSPAQNADRYFGKAKKARVARDEAAVRIQKVAAHIAVLKRMNEDLGMCETTDDIKEYIKKYKEGLKAMGVTTNAQIEPPPPFRVFSVAGGFEVWVGKNSANNDLLTMKFAKPADLWFHVRGAGGSHVVLKTKGGAHPIPKESIKQAAGIAAYYSKMKNAGTVPVAYCERKYVRKPKGSDPGSVVLEREEVIFVKPQLP